MSHSKCQHFFYFFKNVTHDILLLHILTILPDDCQMENQPHHWTNNVYLFNTFISFLFTHPIWDVTDTEVKTLCTLTISTHTSRVGCDNVRRIFSQCRSDFYSHIPCGMWHGNGLSINSSIKISTHTSRVGCDLPALHNIANRFYFYSHIPCGMWPILEAQGEQQYDFYSHIPCGMWLRGRKAGKIIWRFLLTHPVWDVTWTHGV